MIPPSSLRYATPVPKELGLDRRLRRILPPNRAAIWLPLDAGLISGPEEHLRDPRKLLSQEVIAGVTSVLGFKGMFVQCREQLSDTPLIVNLTASTIRHEHTRKILIGTVEEALTIGAEAIACHLNITSPYEGEQIRALSHLADTASRFGMPVVAMAYPRNRRPDGTDENYLELRRDNEAAYAELVRHSVRLSVELGASVVKTTYTGSASTFESVVDSAVGVPVLIAGERLMEPADAIRKAEDAVRAGASGVAFGRQIFERDDPVLFIKHLRAALDEVYQANPTSGTASL